MFFCTGELGAPRSEGLLSLPAPGFVQQEQMEDMRKREDHLEKQMTEVSMQNKRLADPLQEARDEMSEMQKKLRNYERDKQILAVSFLQNSSPSSAPYPGLGQGGASAKCLLRPRSGRGP